MIKKLLLLITIIAFSAGNLKAQVANYTFSQSIGSYSSINAGALSGSGTGIDEFIYNIILPTPFPYNGNTITTVGFSPNGYLIMGNTTSHGFVPISSTATSNGVICALAMDLISNAASSEMRWQQIGQEIIFEWKGFKRWDGTPLTETISFQIRLNTTNGVINIVYDGATTIANSSARIPQVGLRGSTNADYNARRLTTSFPDTTPTWDDTGVAAGNAFNVRFTSGSPVSYPLPGLTYTWTPPSCLPPSNVTATPTSTTSANLSWTAPATPPSNGYQWEVRTSGAGGSGATGLTDSGSTLAGTTNASTTVLAINNTYTLYVRSNCGAGGFTTWVASATFYVGYCTPTVVTNTSTYINDFSTSGGTSNISNLTSGFASNGYQDNYNTMTVSQYTTGSVNFNLALIGGTAGVAIWVDWNNNFLFDTSERVFLSGYTEGPLGALITVPVGTALGNYRMRVKIDFNSPSPNPCTNGGPRAETEDYKFTVIAIPPCASQPSVNAATSITATTATLNWAAASPAPAAGYQYYISTSAVAPITGTAPSGSVGAGILSANITSLTPNTVYYYWVRSNCNATDQSAWAGPRTFPTPPVAPSNDNCSGPINLTCGTTNLAGTTVGSTNVPTTAGCSQSNFGVWYTFLGDGQQTTITSTAASGYDHEMAIASGVCSGLTNISCRDTAGSGGMESYTFITTVGVNYYVYISHYLAGNSTTGNFTISRSCTTVSIPPNNNCGGAINLAVSQTCTYTTYTNEYATATAGVPAPGCASYSGGDVWFSVVVPSTGNITIDMQAGVMIDSGLAIYTGTCGVLTLLECDDDDSANGLMSSITRTGLTPGQTLYIRVWEYGNDNNGTFGICVTTTNPPINDHCTGAINLSVGSNCVGVYGNTDFATQSSPACVGNTDDDVWYSFNAYNSSLTLTLDPDSVDMAFEVFSGTCSALTSIACINNVSGAVNETTTLNGLVIGDTYFVRVYSVGTITDDFLICITAPPGVTNGAYVSCPGNPSESLFSTLLCSGTTSLGNTITGSLNAATDPIAFRPEILIQSTDPCGFATNTSNYTFVDFTVTATGTYVFAMATPAPYFDSMGYITQVPFTPGTCASGIWVAGDDDDGPNLDPQITANLSTGVTYRLHTTKFSFSNTTHTGPFTWNVTSTNTIVNWYTTAVGGIPIGSGTIFNPVGVSGSGLPDTNTPGTYSFWAGCTNSPSIRTQADYVIGKSWNGSVDTNWYVNNNWTPNGIPNTSDCLVIPSTARNPIINGTTNGNGYNIRVLTGANLTMLPNATLTIVDQVTVASGAAFTLENSASLIQVNNVTNIGNILMKRDTNIRRTDYVYWASPVNGFPVTSISPSSPTSSIWEWIPTITTRGNGPPPTNTPLVYGDWSNFSGTMVNGKGYIVRGPSSFNSTPQLFTASFQGVPNNGNVNVPVLRGNYDGPNYLDLGGIVTKQDDNWNLLGNPYPSAIDSRPFLILNTNLEGAVHLWTHGTEISTATGNPFYNNYVLNYSAADYLTYNLTGPSIQNGYQGKIASGQSFMVAMNHTNATPGTVTFNNGMRSINHINSQFFRQSIDSSEVDTVTEEYNRIWLDMIGPSSQVSKTLIGYVSGATMEKDRLYDAFDLDTSGINLYSLIGDESMVIQGRALPFDDQDQVPLGVSLPIAGNYIIAIDGVDGLFENPFQNIFLEDKALNVIHNFRNAPYSFNIIQTGTFNDRFVLRYNSETLGIGNTETNTGLSITAPNGAYIKVISRSTTINSVIVYDVLGRVLIDNNGINQSEFTIKDRVFSAGTYIVKATLSSGKQKVQKVILKQ